MKEPHWHLQRLVLSLLHEAGEEDVVCLLNTIRVSNSSAVGLDAFVLVLKRLHTRGLCVTGDARDPATGTWIDHAAPDEMLASIPSSVVKGDAGWRWLPQQRPFSVLLTTAGMNEATRVLEEDGHP